MEEYQGFNLGFRIGYLAGTMVRNSLIIAAGVLLGKTFL